MPSNEVIEEVMRSISTLQDQGQERRFSIRPAGMIVEAEAEVGAGASITAVTILVVYRKESLAIEKTDDSKDNFLETVGSATYSNSQPTVSSYVSVFESMWQQLYNHIKEVNEQLLATEKAKEEFISMISHELKTPLVPLKGYAQMLLRPKIMRAELNELQKNAIEAMERNIAKLQTLVDDVMDVYELDIGKLKFSMTDTDITKLINEMISELRPLALANLIRNSIDLVTDNGDGKIIVRVETDSNQSGMTIFTVEDNGIGINTEKVDKLFQKFYQIDTGYIRKHAGTGLGLVICKGIVDAHGGNIWLDKSYRGGAAIKFTLPQKGKQAEMEEIWA
jgi:signal transduction histidine kinase